MKLRTLILFGAGIMTGLAIARKMSEDDPEVLHGPTRSSESNPAVRAMTSSPYVAALGKRAQGSAPLPGVNRRLMPACGTPPRPTPPARPAP